ncbi:MAG: diacylglycerol kinase family protein [Pirellulales bacterium]
MSDVPQKQVLIAANPKSGASSGRQAVAALRDALNDRGYSTTIYDSLADLSRESDAASEAGRLRCVVSAGGDGTAAAVVNLIPATIPMVLFPLGTENLLARYLGQTQSVEQAVATVESGREILLDAGSAGGRLFLIMLSCGFDAHVVRELHSARKGHIRRSSYFKPIWQAMRSYRYPQIEIEIMDSGSPVVSGAERPGSATESRTELHIDDQRLQATWFFAFNLPRYAAGLPFCPQADGSDGKLDICTFRRGGTWRGLIYLSHLWFGRHQQLQDFQHTKARRFRLSSSEPIPYQVDGDPGGTLPLDVEVLPGRLRLLVPPTE